MIRAKEPVTEKTPSVTKKALPKSLVTKIREMATKATRGRPRNPNKLTASQKQKAYRERKKATAQ